MGKKKQQSSLGRTIIRDRFANKGRHRSQDSLLHTCELDDGYDWNKLNLRSVTEESSLEEFLATAEMAGTEFTAEKLNIKFVSQESRAGVLSPEEMKKMKQTQDDHRQLLNIPRRPVWSAGTSATELDKMERDSFLEWRRKLSMLQEVEGLVLTPFERNLEFWRQLWRVIERSDIIVQIVDARNPLLFRAEDLEKYVKEVSANKLNMVLINKADYLTQNQREIWASYFSAQGVRIAFWSAVAETERLKEEAKKEREEQEEDEEEKEKKEFDFQESESEEDTDEYMDEIEEVDEDVSVDCDTVQSVVSGATSLEDNIGQNKHFEDSEEKTTHFEDSEEKTTHFEDSEEKTTHFEDSEEKTTHFEDSEEKTTHCDDCEANITPTEVDSSHSTVESLSQNTPNMTVSSEKMDSCDTSNIDVPRVVSITDVLDGPELIELFQTLHTGTKFTEGVTTIGMVGYPNVGKSSTINALLQTKKVPVSATPGRTKHFQTLFLDKTLMLCDCPGLVMPTFVNTKADMVISGILPIDQMRDYVSPTAVISQLIPRKTFENLYGIMIPKPREGEDENRPPTPHELLGSYGYMRGFMTHKGIPDFPKSARMLLKDFVKGKLLYCVAPPGCDEAKFEPTPLVTKATKERSHPQQLPVGSRHKSAVIKYRNEVDKSFFAQQESQLGIKGRTSIGPVGGAAESGSQSGSRNSLVEKPWKRHKIRGKKEKLRRLHSHLDA